MIETVALSQWAADHNLFPIAALIIGPDGSELAKATNAELDPHHILSGTPLAHAEIAAIIQACHKTGNARLPVGSRMITSCEPCLMCLGAMYLAGISEFVYGNSIYDTAEFADMGFKDKWMYEEAEKKPQQRTMVGTQIEQGSAFSVLQKWKTQVFEKTVEGKY